MKFDFTWFIPAIVKYRTFLGEVLVASFFLQLFALLTPLFTQVVIDKVLVHKGFTTLHVLAVGMIALALFDAILGGLRTYLFSHTTNRIDVGLGAQLFRHVLALPLAYFEARRVGDTVARVRELEHIRQFLTSHSVTVVLDVRIHRGVSRRHVVLQPDPHVGRHGVLAALCLAVCGHYAGDPRQAA